MTRRAAACGWQCAIAVEGPSATAPWWIHTDLGSLTTTGSDRSTTLSLSTQGGYVAAWLVSDTPGTALVTINVADSRTQAYVDFLPRGQSGMVETHIVRLSGGWTGYATQLNEVEARDKAWAQFGKLRLEGADCLQLDVDRMILRGRSGGWRSPGWSRFRSAKSGPSPVRRGDRGG